MAAPKKDDDKNPGTAEVAASADTALADKAGISEGEVKALRDDAGLNQSPGHEANVHAYALSPAGKEWAEGEKDRQKAYEAEEKRYAEEAKQSKVSDASAKYREAAGVKDK